MTHPLTRLTSPRLLSFTACTAFFVLACASLTGCRQNEGDRCQVDSDCGEGLVCCNPLMGICTKPGMVCIQLSTRPKAIAGRRADSSPRARPGSASAPIEAWSVLR